MSPPPEILLGLLPAIVLLVALLCGRYPGEEIVARLTRRPRFTGRRASAPSEQHYEAPYIPEKLLFLAVSRPLRGPPSPSYA